MYLSYIFHSLKALVIYLMQRVDKLLCTRAVPQCGRVGDVFFECVLAYFYIVLVGYETCFVFTNNQYQSVQPEYTRILSGIMLEPGGLSQ
jgi:hypothetical protein